MVNIIIHTKKHNELLDFQDLNNDTELIIGNTKETPLIGICPTINMRTKITSLMHFTYKSSLAKVTI